MNLGPKQNIGLNDDGVECNHKAIYVLLTWISLFVFQLFFHFCLMIKLMIALEAILKDK